MEKTHKISGGGGGRLINPKFGPIPQNLSEDDGFQDPPEGIKNLYRGGGEDYYQGLFIFEIRDRNK